MRLKRVAALGLALGLVAATALAASAGSSRDRITGGGQVLVSTEGGAGDTIAFQAQNRENGTSDFATGQIQYVDRTGGTGQGQTTYHGAIICLRVMGNMGKAAGEFRDGTPFQLLVEDNGEGAAANNDIVFLQRNQDPTCDPENDDDDGETELARGNAQVYDAP